jgi:hypothetical protein
VDDQIHVLEQGCLRDEALHADVFGQPAQSAGVAVGADGHQDVEVQRGQSSGRRAQDERATNGTVPRVRYTSGRDRGAVTHAGMGIPPSLQGTGRSRTTGSGDTGGLRCRPGG